MGIRGAGNVRLRRGLLDELGSGDFALCAVELDRVVLVGVGWVTGSSASRVCWISWIEVQACLNSFAAFMLVCSGARQNYLELG